MFTLDALLPHTVAYVIKIMYWLTIINVLVYLHCIIYVGLLTIPGMPG